MTPITAEDERYLERMAVRIRKGVVRMIKAGKAGHLGGALSIADILACLYFKVLKVDPANPGWRERDRVVLSAGHKCLALYAVLAEKGFFDASLLDSFGSLGSRLPGHPDMHKLPGVETSTGALGHGLSIGGGMALGLRLDGLAAKVYVIMGDGELAEGSNWEAAAAASHHRLDNLVVFVDRNGFQICGKTVEVMSYEPLAPRWEAFGWVARAIDGHNIRQILETVAATPFVPGRPSVIIADTVKAKGLSFAENKLSSHYWRVTAEEMALAEQELAEMERRVGACV
jgi:transketolase